MTCEGSVSCKKIGVSWPVGFVGFHKDRYAKNRTTCQILTYCRSAVAIQKASRLDAEQGGAGIMPVGCARSDFATHAKMISLPVPQNRKFVVIAHKPRSAVPLPIAAPRGALGSAERLGRGCVSKRQIGRLCDLQWPALARAAGEPCRAWQGRKERCTNLPAAEDKPDITDREYEIEAREFPYSPRGTRARRSTQRSHE